MLIFRFRTDLDVTLKVCPGAGTDEGGGEDTSDFFAGTVWVCVCPL